jgi:hypothetical protein
MLTRGVCHPQGAGYSTSSKHDPQLHGAAAAAHDVRALAMAYRSPLARLRVSADLRALSVSPPQPKMEQQGGQK